MGAANLARGEAAAEIGFFGKVATHGDFVANRFDRSLREPLDRWLQRALEHSRRILGADWPTAFAGMPPWRFVLGPGVAGQSAVMGVMMASSDRVGRSFPLLLVARLPAYEGPASALCRCGAWFTAAEAEILTARTKGFALDRFDAAVARMVPDLSEAQPRPGRSDRGRSFWWTTGRRSEARRFSASGLPAPEEFSRFLGGSGGQVPVPSPVAARPSPVAAPLSVPAAPSVLSLQTQAMLHPGTRLRSLSLGATDGERGDVAALAEGQGTHAAGKAAALVLDRLTRLAPSPVLADLLANAKGALGSANTLLRTAATNGSLPETVAVTTLIATENAFAVLWAGDIRAYLLRDGMMRCLTRDHVELGLQRRLARSIGGSAQLACEVVVDELIAGDRLLLSTNILTRVLAERDVAARLADLPLEAVPEALVQDALVAGAGENLGVLVAEATP